MVQRQIDGLVDTKLVVLASPRLWGAVIAVLLVPLLLHILAICFLVWVAQFSADPDYIYLLNGLNLAGFHHTDLMSHPGVPAQMLSAVVICAVWLARVGLHMTPSMPEDVMTHPELYLSVIHVVISLFGSAGVFFLGWRLLQATGRIVVACAAQLPFLLSFTILTVGLPHVSAEAFLIGLTAFLTGVQVPLVFSWINSGGESRLAIPVGLLLGGCVATKMTAAPLYLTVFLFRAHRARAIAIGVGIVTTIVLTLPISHRYGELVRFLLDTVTHTGRFGFGELGLPPISEFWQNAQIAWTWAPEIIISVAACLALVLLRAGKRYRADVDLTRLFIVAGLTVGTLLAVVIRHPPIYYLAVMVATAGLAISGAVYLLVTSSGWRRWYGAVAGALLVGLGLNHAYGETTTTLASWRAESLANKTFLARYASSSDGCAIVHYDDPREVIEWKLLFGIRFAGFVHIPTFANLFPSFRIWDPYTRRIYRSDLQWEPDAEASSLLREKCVYFVGYILDQPAEFLTLRARANDRRFSLAVYEYRPPGRDLAR
jgi:hypothetical protein